ncbi:acyl-CoA carboxylase epsilon subunit [Nocardia callitridis]|uniref:Acyl-CoA carboxylase subunit epsilon n=1 Tax=Nocardia callitridis TaxID=648753 RepID=A0ABP9KZD8_9NOCA
MTTVAEQEVLSAVELDLTVDPGTEGQDNADAAAKADDSAASSTTTATAADGTELFRVVKGAPTDVDLAALVAVLTAAANTAPAQAPSGPPDMWGAPTLLHRTASPFSPYAFPHLSHQRD